MRLMFRKLAARVRARPRAIAAAGLLIAAAAAAGGWAGVQQGAPEVAMTAARRIAVEFEPAPPPPPEGLQSRLAALAQAYGEDVGIAVTDIEAGWTAEVDGEGLYPQQSVSKLWVAVATLEAVDRGTTALDRVVLLGPDDRSVFYQPLGRRIRNDGIPISIQELLRWAITESDNSANDKLMRELGGADAVTTILADKGLGDLRVGAYERDLQAMIAGMSWRPEYGIDWNFQHARAALPDSVRDAAMDAYLANPADGASPVAIAHALAALKKGELLSPASTEVLVNLLHDTRTGPRRLKAGLPAGFALGHKTGTGQDWRGASVGINDVGLITAPDGRTYAVAVMMRRTSKPVGTRLAFMQSVSRAVAEHWQASRDLPADRRVAAAAGTVETGL